MDQVMFADVAASETLVEQETAALERIRRARAVLGDEVVILGHHYQRDEVVQFADFTGDSYQLSKEGARVSARVIVFAGVHFMAESAVILGREDQVVILPNMKAGCSMADMGQPGAGTERLGTAGRCADGRPGGQRHAGYLYQQRRQLKAFVGEHGGTVCTSSNARGAMEMALAEREKGLLLPGPASGAQHRGVTWAFRWRRWRCGTRLSPGGG